MLDAALFHKQGLESTLPNLVNKIPSSTRGKPLFMMEIHAG